MQNHVDVGNMIPSVSDVTFFLFSSFFFSLFLWLEFHFCRLFSPLARLKVILHCHKEGSAEGDNTCERRGDWQMKHFLQPNSHLRAICTAAYSTRVFFFSFLVRVTLLFWWEGTKNFDDKYERGIYYANIDYIKTNTEVC